MGALVVGVLDPHVEVLFDAELGRRLGHAPRRLDVVDVDVLGTHRDDPGYLVFPSEGCWRVTTRAGASRVSFVINVVDCVRRECAEV